MHRVVAAWRDGVSPAFESPLMTDLARPILMTMLCATASPAFAIECFSIYDAKNVLVYQSSTTPIDLSRSISDQMARRFPARYLVISDLGSCPETGVATAGTPAQAAAILPSRTGDGPGAFGADATSPAPSAGDAQVGDSDAPRGFTRAPGGRR